MFALGDNQSLTIGKNNFIRGTTMEIIDDNNKCIIGEDCIFSTNININGGDWHTIIENNTTNIVNKQKNPITIGNHCWIGANVTILKNAVLPNNTIVGINSVVSKKFTEENIAIAGNPAKIVKNNLDWDCKKIKEYEETLLKKNEE